MFFFPRRGTRRRRCWAPRVIPSFRHWRNVWRSLIWSSRQTCCSRVLPTRSCHPSPRLPSKWPEWGPKIIFFKLTIKTISIFFFLVQLYHAENNYMRLSSSPNRSNVPSAIQARIATTGKNVLTRTGCTFILRFSDPEHLHFFPLGPAQR